MRRAFVLLAAAASIGAAARNAAANGRFPASNAVVVESGHPDLVLARVTFGLLLSRDAGRTWSWICERAVGFNGVEDPAYAIAADGSLLAGTSSGVRYSTDGGCTWTTAEATGKEIVVDLASRSQEPRSVVALASGYESQGDAGELLYRSFVLESTDGGKTFTILGKRLDPSLLAHTVEVADGDPNRIYLSASAYLGVPSRNTGFVLTSKDRGKTFTRTTIPLEGSERGPYIAAVDPRDPNRLYVRTGGAPDASTRILLSEDAGKRFRTVHTSKGPLKGFALSADGSRIVAGGPADGLIVGATSDFAFKQTSIVQVQCLRASGAALWACSNEASGFFLATTGDEGAHFDAKLHVQDLTGPMSCPADSAVTRECGKEWFKLQKELGIKAKTEAPAEDAGPRETPAAPPVKGGGGDSVVFRWWYVLIAIVVVVGRVALGVRRFRRKR